ncbi:MAG TPA: LPXTG cell wall anchor domain-containing protein [Thermoanaerobaculia bacterium]
MFRGPFRFVFLAALSVLVLLGVRGAFAQNADQNTAGPTKNDFRLRIVEPREGATIAGGTVQVTVTNVIGQSMQKNANTSDMPNPSYRIYLGNTLMGEMKRDQNVFTMENVPAGSHKLVVQALNPSGEIIGRQEVGFRTVKTAAPANVESRPQPAATETTEAAANPPPVTEAAPAPAYTYGDSKPAALPKTASSAPGAALAGLGLIFSGLLVSRKRDR